MADNIENDRTYDLLKTITNPSKESGIIFNNNLTSDDGIKKINENEEDGIKKINKNEKERYTLERNVKKFFDENVKTMIQSNNEHVLEQVLTNKEIGDSLILEKNIAQEEEIKNQKIEKIQPKLDDYLRNNSVSELEDMYIEDDMYYEENLLIVDDSFELDSLIDNQNEINNINIR